jgi:hypothetical protein
MAVVVSEEVAITGTQPPGDEDKQYGGGGEKGRTQEATRRPAHWSRAPASCVRRLRARRNARLSTAGLASVQHVGQPLARTPARSATAARHTCDAFLVQRHQIRRPEPAVTSKGVSRPFFVGCHSRARLGLRLASAFVTDGRMPAQKGHRPCPCVRLPTLALQTWSAPFGHLHQHRLDEPWCTSAGVSRLRCGCHSAAIFGKNRASDVLGATRRPLQTGQPAPRPILVFGLASQT